MAGNTVKEMTMNLGKLDKFERHDFRRWQKKMHFLLTTLKVVYVLITPMLELLEDDTVKAIMIRTKWENDDYICRGHILNEDAFSKKFLVSNFNNYKMVDSRLVMEQFNELLRILGQYIQHGLKKDESISVSSIIDNRLRIEESLRAHDSDKGKGKEVDGPTMNMTEEVRLVTSRGIAVVVIGKTQMLVVRERGLRTNPKNKIDSSAITRVCKERCWFKIYEPVEDGSVLYMGDDHFAPVHGKGSVVLEFSSGKSITLFNVLYVPKLHKNLISGHVLNKCRYEQVYESDKYILSKSGVFVGFGYYSNGHVHYKRMLEMSKDELIPAIDENPDKCTTCMAVVMLSDPKRITLGEKGIDCIFVGYAEHFKAYWYYVIEPNDFVSINSIIESRDKIFDENFFSSILKPKDIISNSVESQRDDHSDDIPSETPKPRKGKRVRKDKSYGSEFQLYLVEGSRNQVGSQYSYCYSIKEDPRTYNEAMQSRDDAFWKEAIVMRLVLLWKIIHGSYMIYLQRFIHYLVSSTLGCQNEFLNGDFDEEMYIEATRRICLCLVNSIRTDQNQVDKTKKFLSSKFSMKDMGETDHCSPMSTPMDPVEKLKPNIGKPVDQLEYSRAISCLMYAMTSTRPDIANAVGRLSARTKRTTYVNMKFCHFKKLGLCHKVVNDFSVIDGHLGIEGLAEWKASASNLRRIQVKDIVKEVEDYLKIYSSAEMDISWYVEGIRYGSKESQMW
ncbi:hypothetical protein Tco_0686601 [Tanacetum coccineum]